MEQGLLEKDQEQEDSLETAKVQNLSQELVQKEEPKDAMKEDAEAQTIKESKNVKTLQKKKS
jgi:hypothetical protein